MALTTCKECGNEISTKAEACPKCGAKIVRTSGCAKVVLGIILLFILLAAIGQCSRNAADPATSQAPSAGREEQQPTPAATQQATLPVSGSQWTYGKDEDPMANGVSFGAMVKSTNTVEFGFPYAGPQHGTLTLRTHPRHGKDVILSIERGQFLCRSYEDCTILVRFDDQKAQKYSAVGASDGSTETIFIRNYSRFLASMQKAKTVRIAAEIYQQGSPAFEFDVSGFDPKKYNQEK